MSIKSDRWIRRMAIEHRMIEPFADRQVRQGVISYGVSSYGYDMRVAREFRIFTNVLNSIVDPKNFDPRSFVEFEGDVCIVPPNSFALASSVEYFRIPRNVITVTVGKSTYARCFSADTRVALVDGTVPTFEDLTLRAEAGEMLWGYALGACGRILVAALEAPRYIARDALLEITLDNAETIRCTGDHNFILRDGRIVPASELRPGDSLMPLYRQLIRGYEAVYQPVNGHLTPTHRLADEWNVRNRIYADRLGTYRHHRDHDRRNNMPWNIERMAAHEHVRHHNAETYGETYAAARGRLLTTEFGDRRPVFRRFPDVVASAFGRTARNHKIVSIRELPGEHDVYCLTVPEAGNFALAAGVFVENCGVITNVTPFEPEWEGHVTLEISNTTPLPAKIYANEGIAQVLFFEGDEPPETSYKDKQGKYQGQHGVTLPKI